MSETQKPKGIVLAGGSGSRLMPMTAVVSKQILPLYDKPMIYYPISVLMLAGVDDILVISTPHDLPLFESLLGDGSAFGVTFSYAEQAEPKGIAEAFLIAETHIGNSHCALILGDNIFFGNGLPKLCQSAIEREHGATVFAHQVSDPQRYGVVSFDENADRATEIGEKPENPKSNWAVTGLYFYDNNVVEIAKSITPSKRAELEISDINQVYLERGDLNVIRLGRGFAWLDTGTPDSMHEAASFVRTMSRRLGIQIACLEEIAYRNGWITNEEMTCRADQMGKTDYADYLRHQIGSV